MIRIASVDRKADEARRADEAIAILLGAANKFIPLNGGSETRLDAYAADLGIEFAVLGGYGVRLGPAKPEPLGPQHLPVLIGISRRL